LVFYTTDVIPENFTVSNVTSRSISFSWDHPNRSATNLIDIIEYTVTCSGVPSQNTSSTEITIGGLEPFTNYSCTVFSRVEGNRGNGTETITQQTAEEGNTVEYLESVYNLKTLKTLCVLKLYAV
jgi:hypothetical protein